MQWLAELEKALTGRDLAALQKLFHQDSHWRDVLALTWRIDTVSGGAAVAAKLLEHAARAKPRGFALDPERTAPREVTRGGEPISLTSTEFELLRYLMRNPRKALSRSEVLRRVWNYDFGGRSSIVDLYVSYLRKKVDAGREPMIHTVRGVGYMLRPPE